jgi:hypothetical protein
MNRTIVGVHIIFLQSQSMDNDDVDFRVAQLVKNENGGRIIH